MQRNEVIVITGRDKGKRGTVLSRVDDRHVTVEGINVAKKQRRFACLRATAALSALRLNRG